MIRTTEIFVSEKTAQKLDALFEKKEQKQIERQQWLSDHKEWILKKLKASKRKKN